MLLEIIILLFTALVIFNWWAHGYWKRRNVFSIPKTFLLGNFWELIMRKKVSLMFCDMYKKYKKHRMVGFYCFYKPMLFITDPEIVKRVLATDFKSFSSNGFVMEKEIDPFMGHSPFTAKTVPLWKELRSIQSTNMTPLKLKEVVPGMAKIAEPMYEYIRNQKKQPVDVLDIATRAAVDTAVLYGFGIEPKSFSDSEFSFMKHASGEKLFSATFWTMISAFFLPWINKLFKLRFTSKGAEDFFLSMTKTNIEHRENSKITRGDLFDSVLKLNKKRLEQGNKAYSDQEMTSHFATFYLDGTVTSSMMLTFLLLELAKNQDVQDKLRKEIISVGKRPEDFDIDKINSIAYLQMVFDETMRLHAPVTLLSRLCTQDIVMEDVKISEGTKVFISPMSFHYDPEYFPDPEKFDPERFSEIKKEAMTKYTFMPFGEGPRICVGMKYAVLFMKTTIVLILLNYKILPTGDENKCLHDIDHFLLLPKANAKVEFEEL